MEQKKKFEPFERIILKRKGCNGSTELWFCCKFSNYDGDYITTVGGNGFCIEEYDILPFKGNAHLVGTSDMPEEEVELKYGDVIFCFDELKDFDEFNLTISKIKGLQPNTILTINEIGYDYCIPFSKFNTNDMEETRKHILCVKNGKLVKAIKEE